MESYAVLRKIRSNGTETYDFKMNKCPLAIEELNEFGI